MNTRLLLWLFVAYGSAVGMLGQEKPQPPRPSTPTALQRWFNAAHRAQNAAEIVSLYADTAVLVPLDGDPRSTRQEIDSYYRELFSADHVVATFVPKQLNVSDSNATEIGDYTFFVRRSGSTPNLASGSYQRVYERQDDGGWKVVADVFQQPPPAPAPVWMWSDALLRFIQGGLAALFAIATAVAAYIVGTRQWRLNYFTKQWWETVKFLHANAKYLDEVTNREYKSKYVGEDLRKYDLVARLSIAFLDDMFFTGGREKLITWFRGSIKLLAGPHGVWLVDNASSYDPDFYSLLTTHLNMAPAAPTPPSDVSLNAGAH